MTFRNAGGWVRCCPPISDDHRSSAYAEDAKGTWCTCRLSRRPERLRRPTDRDLVEGLRMRLRTVLLMTAMVVSACGGRDTTATPSTTESVMTSLAAQPTTTTLGTTTTQVQASSSTTAAPIVGGVATRHESGCSYEGRTDFDVNSEVTFTFVNDTEDWNKGFSVLKVPEGITVEEINEMRRALYLPGFEEEDRPYSPYLPSGQGRGPGSLSDLSVVLNRPGLHALICFEFFDEDDLGQDYAASLFTVND